jgi:predicted GIY-YIG superfamily endonuclease
MKLRLRKYDDDKTKEKNITSSEPPRMIVPFMGRLAYRLTNYIRRKLECDFGYIPGTKLRNLLCNHKLKSKNDPIGIYKISCSCNSNYTGETGRSVNTRFNEHIQHIKHGRTTKSALSKHVLEHPGHFITSNPFNVEEIEPRTIHRKFKGLYIMKCNNSLNRDDGKQIHPIG